MVKGGIKMVSSKHISKNNLILKLHFERLGKIFFNYSIVGLILSFLPFISLVTLIFIWIFVIIFVVLTLFIVLLSEDFRRTVGTINNSISDISYSLLEALPVITSVTIALSISSIILLSLNRNNPHRPRKIISIIVIIIEAILLIFSLNQV